MQNLTFASKHRRIYSGYMKRDLLWFSELVKKQIEYSIKRDKPF